MEKQSMQTLDSDLKLDQVSKEELTGAPRHSVDELSAQENEPRDELEDEEDDDLDGEDMEDEDEEDEEDDEDEEDEEMGEIETAPGTKI